MAFLVEVSPEQSGREGDMNVLQRSMLAILLLASAAHADRQAIAPGTGLQSAVEVDSGANGICQTRARGDDLQAAAVGQGTPFQDASRCGPDRMANTAAAGGDDVQRVGVGASCPGTGTVVVDSGANGIAETRAQGAELVLRLANPRPLIIPIRRHGTASRTVKLAVFNEEFAGPPSRAYTLSVTDGSCPDGTVSQVDADARTRGLQTTANVPAGKHVKGSFVVTLRLETVTSVSRKIPFRCTVDVAADAVDTAPAPDDAANPANNSASVEIDAIDLNDL